MEVVVTFLTSGIVQDKCKGYTLPIAVAIVLSGQYEDDVDNSDEIVYTGQGGNDLLGNKRQIKDQVMHLGNLALKVRHLDYGSYSFDCARIIGDMIFFSLKICLKFSFYKKCWRYFLQL